MTTTELMLDIASGDASTDDAMMQECLGHINISAREFAAAYSISEYPDDLPSIIVEAAENAKLPTNKDEAKEVANTAVIQELSSFYNLMIATAKKVRAATERELRAYYALGKKYGINFDKHNFLSGFLNPLCAAVEKDGLLGKLDDRSFIKGKYAARMVENYGKGMANLMSGYGLSIDNVFGDSVVGMIIRNSYSGKKTIKDLEDELNECKNRKVEVKQVTVDSTKLAPVVIFDQGKTTVNNAQMPSVSMIATYMKSHKNANVRIKGYASPEGSAEINEKIAQARAEAVKTILVKKYKIKESRLEAKGMGVTDELFSENDWNRVATFETFQK